MAEGLSTFLTNAGTVVTAAVGWVGEVCAIITAEPMLFVMVVGTMIAGFAVGITSRFFNAR